MSVLKKKPWIEAKLSTLSGDELKSLLQEMNSTDEVAYLYSLYDQTKLIPSPSAGTTNIVNCIIEFEKGKHPYTGFLIHNSSMCIFIAYHKAQSIALFEIGSNLQSFIRICEECSIEELRRIVENLLLESGEGADVAWGNIGGSIQNQEDLQAEFQDVREVAEGKCKTYVLKYGDTLQSIKDDITTNDVNIIDRNGNDISNDFLNGEYDVYFDSDSDHVYANPSFNSQNASLSLGNPDYATFVFRSIETEGDSYTYVLFVEYIDGNSFKAGDVFLVIETDVPDRWVGGKWLFYKLETAKVDLSNYVDLDSAQTITGTKTFSGGIKAQNIDGLDGVEYLDLSGYAVKFKRTLRPSSSGSIDIGSVSYKWEDLYLSGKIKDGTNEFNADNVFNVINASDIVDNTLTQAQYDLITNGKPTRIVGNFGGYTDGLLFPMSETTTTFYGIVYLKQGYLRQRLFTEFSLVKSTRKLAYDVSAQIAFEQDRTINIAATTLKIKGKTIPDYPTTNTSPQVLTIGANGGNLSWEDNWNPTSVAISDGGTISDTTLQANIQYHRPITLNGYTGYFSCDDGTNYQYHSIMFDSANNVNHLNVITINKNTWVVTFHTSNFALN